MPEAVPAQFVENLKVRGGTPSLLSLKNILFLAFVVRVILIPFFSDEFNFWAFRVFTGYSMEGFNPWTILYRDPTLYWINPWRYPPPFLIFTAPAQFIYTHVGNEIVFLYLIKMPLVVADLITIFFLHKTLMILSGNVKKAGKLTLLYAFNPVTILVSAIWGITDPIPVMFTVTSLYFFLNAVSTTGLATSALFLGWGIAFKLYPIFILPAFIAKLKRSKEAIIFVIFACLPLTVFSAPFLLWDSESYINIVLAHHAEGVHPLSPIFFLGHLPIVQIFFLLSIMTLFIVAYLKNTSIIVNVTLSFFVLYLAFGGLFSTNYFLWIIPFIILLRADKNVKEFQDSRLLPFITIPSIIHALIFNGQYNHVEGSTGIFFWTYHWLRQKIVPFQILPFLQIATPVIGFMNIAIIIYYICKILKLPKVSTVHKGYHFTSLTLFHTLKKNKDLALSSLVILVLPLLIFPKIIPFEPMKSKPEVAPLTLTFFDDFNSSTLNSQWSVMSNGIYTLHFDSNPSYIFLDVDRTSKDNTSIYRGRSTSSSGFFNSSSGTVEIRFRLKDLADKVQNIVVAKTDGGWFGATTENSLTNFVYYFDDTDNSCLTIAPSDDHWHVFKMEYNISGRFIFFDHNFKGEKNPKTLSFLFLGGPCSIDWVKVVIEDFPIGNPSKIHALLALGLPSMTLALITVGLLHPKTFRLHVFRKMLDAIRKVKQ